MFNQFPNKEQKSVFLDLCLWRDFFSNIIVNIFYTNLHHIYFQQQ
jgi:hypothetical protein